jgi:hypothetical protein
MSIASFIQENILGPDWRPNPKPPVMVAKADLIADAAHRYFGRPAPMRLFTPYTKAGRCCEGERDDGLVFKPAERRFVALNRAGAAWGGADTQASRPLARAA